MKTLSLIGVILLFAACNLATTPITPTLNMIPTAANDGASIATPTQPDIPTPEVVGFPGLEPSGAGPCVVTAGSQDVPIHSAPGESSPIIAALGAGLGEVTFQYEDSWYAISWYRGTQEIIGWLAESQIRLDGTCDYLKPPTMCSVESAVGRNVDIHAEPRADSPIIGVLGDIYTAPFVERSTDGWFGISVGEGQTGWIAPDEGRLVGC